MFGNLRLYERHQTPTSYQVLSMQIQFVTHVFPRQLEKKKSKFQKISFLLVAIQIFIDFLCSDTANSLLFFTILLYFHQ